MDSFSLQLTDWQGHVRLPEVVSVCLSACPSHKPNPILHFPSPSLASSWDVLSVSSMPVSSGFKEEQGASTTFHCGSYFPPIAVEALM